MEVLTSYAVTIGEQKMSADKDGRSSTNTSLPLTLRNAALVGAQLFGHSPITRTEIVSLVVGLGGEIWMAQIDGEIKKGYVCVKCWCPLSTR